MYLYMSVFTCVFMCEDQRLPSGISPLLLSTYSFETVSLTEPRSSPQLNWAVYKP